MTREPGRKRVSAGKGQTAIETLFMLFILLFLFFLIAEFARAWYLKNSLNNAVRVAARLAAVTPNLAPDSDIVDCPDSTPIINTVCSSPGVPNDERTSVRVFRTEDVDPTGGNLTTGDTVTVNARSTLDLLIPFVTTLVIPDEAESEASMRYE